LTFHDRVITLSGCNKAGLSYDLFRV